VAIGSLLYKGRMAPWPFGKLDILAGSKNRHWKTRTWRGQNAKNDLRPMSRARCPRPPYI